MINGNSVLQRYKDSTFVTASKHFKQLEELFGELLDPGSDRSADDANIQYTIGRQKFDQGVSETQRLLSEVLDRALIEEELLNFTRDLHDGDMLRVVRDLFVSPRGAKRSKLFQTLSQALRDELEGLTECVGNLALDHLGAPGRESIVDATVSVAGSEESDPDYCPGCSFGQSCQQTLVEQTARLSLLLVAAASLSEAEKGSGARIAALVRSWRAQRKTAEVDINMDAWTIKDPEEEMKDAQS
jgi:hypothetical protein